MAETEEPEPFFTVSGNEFVPAPHGRSWWAPEALHGRLLGALAARAVERDESEPGLHCSRLTVDLFRTAPLAPVRVETTRIRDGHRIRVVDVLLHGGNSLVARASAVLLRRGEQPTGTVPSTPPWDAPDPDELPTTQGVAWSVSTFDEHNEPTRHWGAASRRRMWLRDTHPLVAGESLSPLVRVALAADSASPLAHAGDTGLGFINADYTLSLSRLPLSDAIGMESTGHSSEDGIAVGHCTVFDTVGVIGYCLTTAVANRRSGRRTE